jgi:hypothetical protein
MLSELEGESSLSAQKVDRGAFCCSILSNGEIFGYFAALYARGKCHISWRVTLHWRQGIFIAGIKESDRSLPSAHLTALFDSSALFDIQDEAVR